MNGNKYTNILDGGISEYMQVREIKDGWKELVKSDGIVLSSIKYKDNQLSLCKIEGNIPVNYEKASRYYFDCLDGQKKCREMCDKYENIQQVDNDTFVSLFKSKGKLFISSRETLTVQHRRRLNDNEILVARVHLDDHPIIPPNKDAVRAQQKVYAIFLTKLNEQQTNMQAFILMDPKGNIPNSLINTMIEKQHKAYVKDVEMIKQI